MELDEFIKTHRRQALSIIRKSKYFNLIDNTDEEEITHCGLWEVWKKFNPERACLSRFIYVVLQSYIIRLVKKKIRVRQHESHFGDIDYSYIQEDDIAEMFTENEWKCVSPLLETGQKKAAEQINVTFREYRILLRVIGKVVKNRLK